MTPPANLEAERALLGALLLNVTRAFPQVAEVLADDDFYLPQHQAVYRAILAARDRGGDPVLVDEELRRAGHKGVALSDLNDLLAAVPTAENAAHYARIVRDDAVRRRLIDQLATVMRAAYLRESDPGDLLAATTATVSELSPRTVDAVGSMADLVDRTRAQAAEAFGGRRFRLKPDVSPLIDHLIPSLGAGEMLVLGARPKAGKSNLAGDLAFGWARQGLAGLILTLEDAPEIWIAREIAKLSDGKLDAEDIRTGQMTPVQWSAYDALAPTVKSLPVRIVDVRGEKAQRLAARIEAAGQRGARWVVVDYAQVVAPSQFRRGASRQEEMSAVVHELKAAAGRAGVALILLSQLKRLQVDKDEPRPSASDLRDSGMLEAQADAVVLLWRRKRSDYSLCAIVRELWKHGRPDEVTLNWMPEKRRYWPAALRAVPPSPYGGGGDA